jgi:hypothetical protein
MEDRKITPGEQAFVAIFSGIVFIVKWAVILGVIGALLKFVSEGAGL